MEASRLLPLQRPPQQRGSEKMPFINQAVAEARESRLLPEGEYNLRIAEVEEGEGKTSGKPLLRVLIEIVGEGDDVEPIFHNVSLATPEDEPKSAKFKLRMIRRLLAVFNLPFEDNGFDTDDWPNAEGKCLVAQEEMEDKNGQATGEYRHVLRLPKFQGEPNDEVAREADQAGSGRGDTGRAAPARGGRAQQGGRGRRT